MMMSPRTDKLMKRATIIATVTASYFLLTADYGPEPNALDPIKKAILSAEGRAKDLIRGSSGKPGEGQPGNSGSSSSMKDQN
ncbi:hypothetical protein MLD38_019768 [Melastoma candidum]|uniref:Uncharacterized protein n=1 Tax=Melastoma candidum TaxID=119954 RepID=A0ACB9QZW8_9MYRT|nr:hypothetical protein MLD38_019768 [Melastoma candidum]